MAAILCSIDFWSVNRLKYRPILGCSRINYPQSIHNSHIGNKVKTLISPGTRKLLQNGWG